MYFMVSVCYNILCISFLSQVLKFIGETIGKEIENQTQGIYPLQNVLIRKVTCLTENALFIF